MKFHNIRDKEILKASRDGGLGSHIRRMKNRSGKQWRDAFQILMEGIFYLELCLAKL